MRKHTLQAIVAMALISILLSCGAMADNERSMGYSARSADDARAWQAQVRAALFERLGMADLVAKRADLPLDSKVVSASEGEGYLRQELSLRATEGRRIRVVAARPKEIPDSKKLAAVVCIHGHGGTRDTPFDPDTGQYKQFGAELARQGYVVVSMDVGQHEVYEPGRTLMGERLWDCMRCVDYLLSLPEVDPARIGCAGLSLGGEMAMWLGGMDTRVVATVSCGFLTTMDHMEQNHCMCWKFPGLRGLVDFADIYALTAPRALQCQNGLQEPESQFNVPLARTAFEEVRLIYGDMGVPGKVELHVHDGGHEIALGALVGFLSKHVGEGGGR